MQHQYLNISYVIIQRTGKFGLDICKWECMPPVQKTWVGFKQYFWASHRKLRDTTDLTVQDKGMHHANMVHNVVAGLQEVLHQEKQPTDTTNNIA